MPPPWHPRPSSLLRRCRRRRHAPHPPRPAPPLPAAASPAPLALATNAPLTLLALAARGSNLKQWGATGSNAPNGLGYHSAAVATLRATLRTTGNEGMKPPKILAYAIQHLGFVTSGKTPLNTMRETM